MQLLYGKKAYVSKVDPCGVCCKQVVCNFIWYMKCPNLDHCCFSDVPRQGSLLSCGDVFITHFWIIKRGGEIVEEFCYHGDMFSSYGWASEVVSARIGSAQKKVIELAGVLVGKQGLSFKQLTKIYQTCIRLVLFYCSETSELKMSWGCKGGAVYD